MVNNTGYEKTFGRQDYGSTDIGYEKDRRSTDMGYEKTVRRYVKRPLLTDIGMERPLVAYENTLGRPLLGGRPCI